MRTLLLLIAIATLTACEEKPVCLKCEMDGQETYEFCDGDHGTDASVVGYVLTQRGYYCTKQ